MTTQLPNPANLGIDPTTGLPIANPNAAMQEINQPQPVQEAPVAATPVPVEGTQAPQAPVEQATPQPLAGMNPDGTQSTVATSPTPTVVQPPQEYVVKPGDTLNAIAQRLGVAPSSITGYRSGNPNRIAIGESLQVSKMPGTPSTITSAPLASNSTGQTGATTPTTSTGKTPFQNVMDTYTQVYQELGLGNLKSRYKDALKEIDSIQTELNDKISDVNNNPWLSSSSRSDQVNKLKEKYAPRLDAATHLASLVEALAKEGEQTAQFLVGNIETDTQNAIETAQKKQDSLDKLAEQDIHPDTVNGRAVLVDYKTKKIVADLGPSTTPGSGDSGILSVSDATLLGLPYGTTKAQAMGAGITPQKPLTEAQSAASGFATRATHANDTITGLETKINSFNPLAYATQSKFEANTVTGGLASDEIKQSRQAERNFLTAVLRKESGASISPTEFAEGERIYFPRPSDDATTLANKAQARADAIGSLNGSAGAVKSTNTPSQATFFDKQSGKTYVQGADGKYYPQ